jgi:type IV pilus assembly protein PilQ
LVKDGDTTVIGGIYVRSGGTTTASVPFLSKIPVLGLLFKRQLESDTRQELLIFITPRILNRQTIAQTL